MPIDSVIERDVPLAVRDFGGHGTAVLLLHGLGGTLDAWDGLGLANRTVAVDLRGHGHSGDGPWEWDSVLDDIEAVIAHFDLDNPLIVGHSLGGMLAVLWARRHPECRGIVNLDGLRSAENDPAHYPGMDEDLLEKELAQLKAAFDAQAAAMGQPVPEAMRAMFPPRALTTVNGDTYARPGADLLEAVRYTPEFRDTIPFLREVTCPAVVVVPERTLPGELMAAFKRGVRRDLTDLPGNIQVRELDASHNMVAEQPQAIAQIITEAAGPE